LQLVGQQQVATTMIANKALLLAVQLAPAEMDGIAARQGERHGNSAETEHTSLHIFTRQQIIEGELVDYATLGQITLVGED
jgi:hypothetical protein